MEYKTKMNIKCHQNAKKKIKLNTNETQQKCYNLP